MGNLVILALKRQEFRIEFQKIVKLLRTKRVLPTQRDLDSDSSLDDVYTISYRIPDTEMRSNNLYIIADHYKIPPEEILNFFSAIGNPMDTSSGLYVRFETLEQARDIIKQFFEFVYLRCK